MPIRKGLVAKHPLPLKVDGVANCSVREEKVGRVVRVHAFNRIVIFVAIICAV